MSPLVDSTTKTSGSHTAVVDLTGIIRDCAEAEADTIIDTLKPAQVESNTNSNIIRRNYTGGSAVKARSVYQAIQKLRAHNTEITVHHVLDDSGA